MKIYKVKKKTFWYFFKFFYFFNFLNSIRMLNIGIENYKKEDVHTIEVSNKTLFRVKMNYVQKGIGVKIMSDLVREEIHGTSKTKNPTKEQIRKYKRSGRELDEKFKSSFKYFRNDLMSRIIKNCGGEKKRAEKIR